MIIIVTIIIITITKATQNLTSFLLPVHNVLQHNHYTYLKSLSKKSNVMMILILIIIIIITQQNLPQNRYFILTSNKPLAIMNLDRIKRERSHSDCNNPFLTLSLSTFPSSHFLPSSHFPSTDSGNMCTYVKLYASIYANIRIYGRASDCAYTNTLTFKSTRS